LALEISRYASRVRVLLRITSERNEDAGNAGAPNAAPKAISVGQYQYDLGEDHLARSLNAVVEDCLNAVGVDVNTVSTPLLARVSGIGPKSRAKHCAAS
jgi:hypothetical protein